MYLYYTLTCVVLMMSVRFCPSTCSSYTHIDTVASRLGSAAALRPTTREMADPQLPLPTMQILCRGDAACVYLRTAEDTADATVSCTTRRGDVARHRVRYSSAAAVATTITTSAAVPASGPNCGASGSGVGGGTLWPHAATAGLRERIMSGFSPFIARRFWVLGLQKAFTNRCVGRGL